MTLFYLLVLALVSPILHLVIGEWASEAALRWILRKPAEPTSPIGYWRLYYCVGLLLSLCLVFVLANVGLPLALAYVISLGAAGPVLHRVRFWLSAMTIRPSLNFALWFTIVLTLGVSLVNSVDGVQTPWRNNYGDLTWHMGMITSFVFGDNFPPQNHLFAGVTLSYPFFMNLWTAALWSLSPGVDSFALVFLYQWMVIWIVIYYALEGDRLPLLPWVVLFGGGAYLIITRALGIEQGLAFAGAGPYAHDLIDKGYPWTPFLTTIWVPQRTAIFGAMTLLTAIEALHRATGPQGATTEGERHRLVFLSGLVLGLSPLVHTHFFLTAAVYGALTLGARVLRSGDEREARLREMYLFLLALLPVLLGLPWIIAKSGIITISGSWMQTEPGFLRAFSDGTLLWLRNAFPWLASVGLFFYLSRSWRTCAVIVTMFLAANVVQISSWNWDQLKIFLGIYLITMSLWQTLPNARARRAHWLLVVLLAPCIAELVISLQRYDRYTVYTKEELKLAEEVRDATSPSAVIAAAPDHNSPVTLTGRKMFYGYEGTLSSHGLDYMPRRELFLSLDKLAKCRELAEADERIAPSVSCPQYLYWSDREKRYWKIDKPPAPFAATKLPQLYELGSVPVSAAPPGSSQ